MVSHHVVYQLVLFALIWLFVMSLLVDSGVVEFEDALSGFRGRGI